MISKSFNLSVALRLLLFATATAGCSVLVVQHNWLPAGGLFFLGIILFFEVIHFLNGVNRKVAFFFDAVTNDDTTLHFTEQNRTRSFQQLHQSFNRLNEHIAELKIENAYRERFFHEMLKSSATGLIAIDQMGYVQQINDSALEFLNLPHIAHMDLLKQKNPDFYQRMQAIRPGQSITIKVLQGAELRLYSLKVALLNFDSNKYRLYSISDIKAEIEENELDSWQKLIRVMTHEIMNSVAPITSLSNTLSRIFIRSGNPLPVSEVTENHVRNIIDGLEVIENTGRGLMRFVEDYRQLTRIPSPVFKPIQIEHWLESIRMLVQPALHEKNIRFQLSVHNAPELIGDEKMLNQVLINLLNNAMDALANMEDKRIDLQVTGTSSGRITITVSDNGKGIPPDELEKIFIPFYTTKENGSGIGLSLSRKIMRLHRGSLSVISEPNVQTRFIMGF